jgi:N-acetylglucosamine-6-phosphate deacetylase
MRLSLPGFIDLQVNGFAGIDFNAADLAGEHIERALAALRRTGVTRCLPTLITAPFDSFARNARLLARSANAAIAGLHMEGPYVSPEDGPRGAHPRQHVLPASRDDFARRQDAADGRIVLVTLAPEVPGAIALIEHLVTQGVRVAIGHTAAAPAEIEAAIAAGATMATHLGNGCAHWLPRHPNAIWELLAADTVTACFIADGHHLPGTTVKAMVRAKTVARSILVTDATAAAGSPAGIYAIGEVRGELDRSGRVSLPGTPYLAGSALTLPDAIANCARFTGLPVADVTEMASAVPSRAMRIPLAGTVQAEWDEARFTLRVVRVDE